MTRTSSLILVSLLAVFGTVMSGTTTSDDTYSKLYDIMDWDQFFVMRSLDGEWVTLGKIAGLTEVLSATMRTSLTRVVRFQAVELEVAKMMMEGTSAQGCVDGIGSFMDSAIDNEMVGVNNSIVDLYSSLPRLNRDWAKLNESHYTLYMTTIAGIIECVRNYPNKESWDRQMSCMNTYSNKYFSSSNVPYSVINSPSMKLFVNTVVSAAEAAGRNLVQKGFEFLNMLVDCAKLSENVDAQEYEQRVVSEFYNTFTETDIDNQMSDAQFQYSLIISDIEREMLAKHYERKAALSKYVIEPNTLENYKIRVNSMLQNYRDTISSTSNDYPEDFECTSTANSTLDSVINEAAASALLCDNVIINDTKNCFASINASFIYLNYVMKYYGNDALLSCLQNGLIFAKNAISKCYAIKLAEFDVIKTKIMKHIYDKVQVLENYEKTFFIPDSLPCSDDILPIANWKAKELLFECERCLYGKSGGNYEVTPSPTSSTETPTYM